MVSRQSAYKQEDDIECLDDLTKTSSLLNIAVTVDNTEDEDDLWVIRMKLYKSKKSNFDTGYATNTWKNTA